MNKKKENCDSILLEDYVKSHNNEVVLPNGSIKEKDENKEGSMKEDSRLELRKELGVVYGVAVIMGLVIGGGIYISPQSVLRHAGSPGLTLVMWLVGGIFSIIGAMCFAEIGVKFPTSGGFYTYLMEFYGPYFGFMYLWQYILLIRCGSNALKTTLLANFILKLFFPTCPIPSLSVKFIASFFAVGMCIVNCLSVKLVARSQTLMTLISIGTLLTISFVGFHHIHSGGGSHLEKPFENSSTDVGEVVLALYNTIFSYSGWVALNIVVEEVKNPKKTLPVSVFISMSTMICLYTLVNLSYSAVLGSDEMLQSEAVAISVGLKVWTPLAWVLCICIAITSCSSYTSGIIVGSRVAFAGARNGQVPNVLSYIHVTRYTPTISIVLLGVLCIFYIWFMEIDFIIQNLTFCNILIEFIVLVAFVRLRLKEKPSERDRDHFRLPLVMHIIYAFVLFVLCVVPLVTKPMETSLVFTCILVSTSILYIVFIKWRPSFVSNNPYTESFCRFLQIIFSSAPPDKQL